MRILTTILALVSLTAFSQDGQFTKLEKGSVTILVNDTSEYSSEYLNELFNWDLSKTYILNRDSLIVSRGVEYGLFDTGLEMDKKYVFEGYNSHMKIALDVTRLNYSTIRYHIEISKVNESETIDGTAHGGVSILGSESDEDDKTGISYFCSEYSNNWKHSSVIIRIDSEENNRAKVIISEGPEVTLQSCPTLRLTN